MISRKKSGYNITESSNNTVPRSLISGTNVFTLAVLFLAIGYLLTDNFESTKDVSARTVLPDGEYSNTFVTDGGLRGTNNYSQNIAVRLSQGVIDDNEVEGQEVFTNDITFKVNRNKKQNRIKLASLGTKKNILSDANNGIIDNGKNEYIAKKIGKDYYEIIQKTKDELLARERYCMTAAIYYEAASEPTLGQIAVAQVILNRKASKRYPNTICGVVFHNSERRNACQFSFACDGKSDKVKKNKAWEKAAAITDDVMSGRTKSVLVSDASHYHADYVRPKWSYSLSAVAKIGRHIFYKSK